jgi:hypothetical protein
MTPKSQKQQHPTNNKTFTPPNMAPLARGMLGRSLAGTAFALRLEACGRPTPGPSDPGIESPRTGGSRLACEPCRSSGTCVINSNSTWFFAAHSAGRASTAINGDSWDALYGASWPLALLDSRRTTTKLDTLRPSWQEDWAYAAVNLSPRAPPSRTSTMR